MDRQAERVIKGTKEDVDARYRTLLRLLPDDDDDEFAFVRGTRLDDKKRVLVVSPREIVPLFPTKTGKAEKRQVA